MQPYLSLFHVLYLVPVNNSAPGRSDSQPIVLNAQFMIGEEVVAEGVVDLVADEIDERQGLKVKLKRKGVTT